jgi:hypothetical protein
VSYRLVIKPEDKIVRIYEESEEDDDFRPHSLGLFSASLQGPAVPDWHVSGPSSVPIADALAWGQQQADVIVVRYNAPPGEPHEFSAGSRQPRWAKPPLPSWPPARWADRS